MFKTLTRLAAPHVGLILCAPSRTKSSASVQLESSSGGSGEWEWPIAIGCASSHAIVKIELSHGVAYF